MARARNTLILALVTIAGLVSPASATPGIPIEKAFADMGPSVTQAMAERAMMSRYFKHEVSMAGTIRDVSMGPEGNAVLELLVSNKPMAGKAARVAVADRFTERAMRLGKGQRVRVTGSLYYFEDHPRGMGEIAAASLGDADVVLMEARLD